MMYPQKSGDTVPPTPVFSSLAASLWPALVEFGAGNDRLVLYLVDIVQETPELGANVLSARDVQSRQGYTYSGLSGVYH